jgi:diphosphomevalonate decarboxylase
MTTATAIAHPNIALVKYWGKRDVPRNLPAVPSVSLTLSGFRTRTEVTWGAPRDMVELDGHAADDKTTQRVLRFLDRIDGQRPPCHVRTDNNFPAGAGLASSASAFAALTLAAARAAGHTSSLEELSVLARQGSGSASRSLWGGFVAWRMGGDPEGSDSHGEPLHGPEHMDVCMVVAVVSDAKKAVGSTEGMERSRHTSSLYDTWVDQGPSDVDEAEVALAARDLPRLGRVMESSTFKMHAVMQTSDPPLLYWQPGTVACLHTVWDLRAKGIGAWVTMDAGPQVKVLCMRSDADQVAQALRPHALQVHVLAPGPGAHLLEPGATSAP